MSLRILSPLHKATRQIEVFLGVRMNRLGIRGGDGHLLSYLYRYGPCRVGELKRVFGYRPSTLTSILDRLTGKGLLRRRLDPEDRRSFLVELTAHGRRVAEQVNRKVRALEGSVLKDISPDQMRGFKAVMQAVGRVTDVQLKPEERP
jgi:DNA-binding MarR family transcriptional regulator